MLCFFFWFDSGGDKCESIGRFTDGHDEFEFRYAAVQSVAGR